MCFCQELLAKTWNHSSSLAKTRELQDTSRGHLGFPFGMEIIILMFSNEDPSGCGQLLGYIHERICPGHSQDKEVICPRYARMTPKLSLVSLFWFPFAFAFPFFSCT
jgi:hypothetical protein